MRKSLLIVALSVVVIAAVTGALFVMKMYQAPPPEEQKPQPSIVFHGYEIKRITDRIAMVVDFSTNVYPVTVRLLAPDKKTEVDTVTVYIPEDIPCVLYLMTVSTGHGVSPAENVVPGTYYLRFIYNNTVLLHQPVDVILDLKVRDVWFCVAYDSWTASWYIMGINLTISNTGNAPVYIDRIDIYTEEEHGWFWLDDVTEINPGESHYISVREKGFAYGVELGGSGTHHVRVVLDLGSTSFSFEFVVTV